MYRIGEFSKMSKVSIKTLRYYDEMDLLKPEYIDPESSYRFYTTQQLIEIHSLTAYRQIGLSINEIKLILSGQNEEDILEKHKAEMLKEKERLKEKIARIDFLSSQQLDEHLLQYKAIIKEIPELIVYSKKMHLNSYQDYFDVIPPLGAEVTRLNPDIQCTFPTYCFISYLDGEYKEYDRYVEFCEAVDRFGTAPEGVIFKKLEPTTVVSVLHQGSYKDIGLAYAYAAQWIDKNGYLLAGNPRENVIDGIWNKECEEEWLTEVQIPIIKEKNGKSI